MNQDDNRKKVFLTLYNQLSYDYQNAILNTFRCLISTDSYPTRRKTLFDVSGTIQKYQKEKGYTDQQVCDKVSSLVDKVNPGMIFDIDTYHKIKYRNTQTSKSKTNWLAYIAKVLEFNEEDYHKYLSAEGFDLLLKRSCSANTIEELYDLLLPNEQTAIFQLATSLYKLSTIPEIDTEQFDYIEE